MSNNDEYHSQTIILTNKKLKNEKNTQKEKNQFYSNKNITVNSAKIERDEEAGKKLKTWGKDYGNRVTQARIKHNPKLSQNDLAKKLQVKLEIVRDIENGKGLYKPNIANNIFKILKVKRNN